MNTAQVTKSTKKNIFPIIIITLLSIIVSIIGYTAVNLDAANKQFRNEMSAHRIEYIIVLERLTRQEERTKASMDILIRHEAIIAIQYKQVAKNKADIAIMPYINKNTSTFDEIEYKLYTNPFLCQHLNR